MIESLHILRPWFIILLPFIVFILWQMKIMLSRSNPWDEQIAQHLRAFMVKQNGSNTKVNSRHYKAGLLSLLLLMMLALMGPSLWQKSTKAVTVKPQVMVLLDQSASMLAQDVKPSRTKRATFLVHDLLDLMPDASVGLIAYAGSEHPLVPMTYAQDIVKEAVDTIDPTLMPSQGNQPAAALGLVTASLANQPNATLIWITDEIPADEARSLSRLIKNAAFETFIIAAGTQQGAPIPVGNGQLLRDRQQELVIPTTDIAAIKKFAQQSDAVFFDQKDLYGDELQTIIDTIDVSEDQNREDQSQQETYYDEWEDLGPWLLIPAALLMALFFRRGLLFAVFIIITPWSATPLQAKTPDQTAWAAYQSGEFDQAALLADDKLLAGSALYRQSEFAKAAQAFSQAAKNAEPGSDAAVHAYYNLGNALAKTGQFDAALGAYNQVLAWNKEHQDAVFNRDLVEKLKKQHEQEQKQPQNQQKNEQNKEGDSKDQQQQQQQQSSEDGQKGKSDDASASDQQGQNQQNQDQQAEDQPESDPQTQQQKADQQKALEEALENFTEQEQADQEEKAKAQALQEQAEQSEAEQEQQPEKNAPTLPQTPPDQQVENPHLDALELQPRAVLRNKMIYQYRRQQQRGPSDDEPW